MLSDKTNMFGELSQTGEFSVPKENKEKITINLKSIANVSGCTVE
jgi:hypothetical protein